MHHGNIMRLQPGEPRRPPAPPSMAARSSPGAGRLLLLPLLLGLMTASGRGQRVPDEDEIPEPLTSDLSPASPLNSWLTFRRNSNKGDNRRARGPSRTSEPGFQGAAPLLARQQELIRGLQPRPTGVCFLCHRPPRVTASFVSRLPRAVCVPRRSLLELRPFGQPTPSDRNLQRGQSFDSSTGRYTAPVSGFYQLTASLRIESGDRVQFRTRESVKAAICIESLCQSNLSIESVMGVSAAGGTFSILLTGILHLQVGEYVSLFVDNASGSAVSVLPESLFSGILLGV